MKDNWKPALGWICVISLAWIFIGMHVVEVVLALKGVPANLPKADSMPVLELVGALLGLGCIHSYDCRRGKDE